MHFIFIAHSWFILSPMLYSSMRPVDIILDNGAIDPWNMKILEFICFFILSVTKTTA